MATGTLKMWNADRGFGFIGDDSGGPDIFLHVSALQSEALIQTTSGKANG
jgi:CspA family cold shock protein